MHFDEIKRKILGGLTLDYNVFVGTHVPNIVVQRNKSHAVRGSFTFVSKATKGDVLHELMEVSKALQETITSSTIGKKKVDELIMLLTNEEDEEKYADCEGEESGREKERRITLKSKLFDGVNQDVPDIWYDMCCLM